MLFPVRQALLFSCILGCYLPSLGQERSFKERFQEAAGQGDLGRQFVVLEEWSAADTNDAELYVAYFNYYVHLGHSSGIRLGNDPQGDDVLQIADPDTSNKEPVGFIYEENSYDPVLVDSGLTYINKGIAKFPQRLDMRLGKIYMFGEVEDYDRFTDEIIRTMEHGTATGYKWTWADNEPLEDPEAYMLDVVQRYIYQLYEIGDDSLLQNMQQIGRAVLKDHPDHVESLSTVAAVHVLNKEYDAALELLLLAERLAPTDDIVTGNIAEAYKRKGDKARAIAYYERTMEIGNEETKAFAKQQIELLKQ